MVAYYDDPEKKIVKKDLFSDYAHEIAKNLAKKEEYRTKSGKKRFRTNTLSQIRKFYDDLLRIKMSIQLKRNGLERSKEENEEFIRKLPYIKMMKAKVSYALSRDKITKDFYDFINENVDYIKDIDDFFTFCNLFEAIIAYSSQYLKS